MARKRRKARTVDVPGVPTDKYERVKLFVDMHDRQHYTYKEIGEMFGVSRQAVWSCISRYMSDDKVNIREKSVVYPGLRNWMEENRVKVADLEKAVGRPIREGLKKGNLGQEEIGAIINITGLTFKELFTVTRLGPVAVSVAKRIENSHTEDSGH